MNDLDNWLNSLESSTNTENTPTVSDNTPTLSESAQSLSEEDIDDILNDFGFSRPENIQAEEITEEEDVYDENMGEGRDLDAEEDADWQGALDSGRLNRVGFDSDGREYTTNSDGQRAYLHNEVVDVVNSSADNEVHSHMPDGEVIDVPIITEEAHEDVPTVSETNLSQEEQLPLNSPTLLLDESTTRFSGAEWFNEIQRKSIILAGLGGIGSWTALQLARMHPASLVLYDDDNVEVVNMAGQLYSRNDIGKSKAAAIADMVTLYTNAQNVLAIKERFTEHTEAGNVMMCGFDNMEARKVFFDAWYNHVQSKPVEERKNCLFLDGRLSMTDLQVFCITGEDDSYMEQYRVKYLFSDSEAEHTVCSMKQTTYLACMIGSIMTNLFTNWAADLLNPILPYDLPFFTEYDAQNMIFKTVK